jgi:hypothetical protein
MFQLFNGLPSTDPESPKALFINVLGENAGYDSESGHYVFGVDGLQFILDATDILAVKVYMTEYARYSDFLAAHKVVFGQTIGTYIGTYTGQNSSVGLFIIKLLRKLVKSSGKSTVWNWVVYNDINAILA